MAWIGIEDEDEDEEEDEDDRALYSSNTSVPQ